PACAFTNGQSFQLFDATLGRGNFSRIQPDPGVGLAWRFDSNKGLLTAVARPQLRVTMFGPKTGTLAWSEQGFHLQVMTNSRRVAGERKWVDYPDGLGSPASILFDSNNPAVFFRLVSP